MHNFRNILKRWVKHKHNQKWFQIYFFPKILIAFKKLKIFSSKISWNNTCSDWAVKWLSLISIKPEQVSKICSKVKHSSHLMHTGSSSPFNEKEWVMKEWPICNWAITVSSFLFVWGQTIHCFKTGNILCNLFSGNLSHSDYHSSNIYLFAHDFKSENGMSSTEMSPMTASLAAESAAKVPSMPTRPGTQINAIFLPPLVRFIQSSKICTKIGWSYLGLKIACKDESRSDNITNDLPLEQ